MCGCSMCMVLLSEQQNAEMLLTMLMMLTSADMVFAGSNKSSLRLGKVKLLKELRSRSAFTDNLSPGGDNNVVNINFMYWHYEALMVNEIEQSVTSIGYINITWEDPELTWNKTEYGGVELVKVQCQELWRPSIIVANSLDPDLLMIDKVDTMRIMSNGSVTYVTPVYMKTACGMDMRDYPFDVQICHIIFMLFLDDVQYVITESVGQHIHHFSITGQWRILSSNISKQLITENDYNSEIIMFTMKMERLPLYYVLCILTPMIVTYSVTSLVFWIPPSSGEKISFLVTIFVSNVLFLNFLAGTLPRNMSNMPKLTFCMIMINIQCLFAMIATVFVVWRYEQEQKESVDERENNLAPNDDKRKNTTDVTNSTTDSNHPLSSARKTNAFRRLGFSSFKIQPLETTVMDKNQMAGKRNKSYWLPSRTCDAIFFCVFHLISLPFILLVFVF